MHGSQRVLRPAYFERQTAGTSQKRITNPQPMAAGNAYVAIKHQSPGPVCPSLRCPRTARATTRKATAVQSRSQRLESPTRAPRRVSATSWLSSSPAVQLACHRHGRSRRAPRSALQLVRAERTMPETRGMRRPIHGHRRLQIAAVGCKTRKTNHTARGRGHAHARLVTRLVTNRPVGSRLSLSAPSQDRELVVQAGSPTNEVRS
jgi:hypothetical protein